MTSGRPSNGSFERLPQLDGTHTGSKDCGDTPTEFRMTKLEQPTILTPHTFFSTTCSLSTLKQHAWAGTCPNLTSHDIVEFPERKCVGVFHAFGRPVKRPKLTKFCRDQPGPG